MSKRFDMSYAGSSISRRKLMARGALAVGTSVMAARSEAEPAVSFARHQGIEKGPGCLRVAACQILNYPDVAKSAEKVLMWIEAAAKDGVDVIAFPEACLCGYADGDYWKTARPDDFQEGERLVIEASKRLDIAVVLGTIHWESEKIYNDVLVIDKGGKVR